MNTIEAAIETMDSANQEVPTRVTIPSEKVMKNRLRLEFEELLEKATAMGLEGSFQSIVAEAFYKRALAVGAIDEVLYQQALTYIQESVEDNLLHDTHEVNLVEVLDACCDQRVVNDGTIAAFGFFNNYSNSPVSIFHAAYFKVHENNMKKFPTDLAWAKEQVIKLASQGTSVQLVESIKYPGRFAFIDINGKYKKPADFEAVDLGEFIPADVVDSRLL